MHCRSGAAACSSTRPADQPAVAFNAACLPRRLQLGCELSRGSSSGWLSTAGRQSQWSCPSVLHAVWCAAKGEQHDYHQHLQAGSHMDLQALACLSCCVLLRGSSWFTEMCCTQSGAKFWASWACSLSALVAAATALSLLEHRSVCGRFCSQPAGSDTQVWQLVCPSACSAHTQWPEDAAGSFLKGTGLPSMTVCWTCDVLHDTGDA